MNFNVYILNSPRNDSKLVKERCLISKMKTNKSRGGNQVRRMKARGEKLELIFWLKIVIPGLISRYKQRA